MIRQLTEVPADQKGPGLFKWAKAKLQDTVDWTLSYPKTLINGVVGGGYDGVKNVTTDTVEAVQSTLKNYGKAALAQVNQSIVGGLIDFFKASPSHVWGNINAACSASTEFVGEALSHTVVTPINAGVHVFKSFFRMAGALGGADITDDRYKLSLSSETHGATVNHIHPVTHPLGKVQRTNYTDLLQDQRAA